MSVAMALLGIALFLTGCGQVVPQNKIAIVASTIGDRSATNAAATAEIYWARRLPVSSGNFAIKIYKFHLGLQDYSWTGEPTVECPQPRPVGVDCVGSHIDFDVNIQLFINHGATNLADKLLGLMNDYQLQAYSGDEDMLARFAAEKLYPFIRTALAGYCLDKQAIDIMRSKAEMNKILLKALNDRFNRYAIVICGAGITSPIRLPADQKARMDQIVKQEYANMANDLRNREYMPLAEATNNIHIRGLNSLQDEYNRGEQESIGIIADAQRQRRDMFIKLVGPDYYVRLEQTMELVKNFNGTNGTHVVIVPETLVNFNIGSGVSSVTMPAPVKGN